MSELTHATLATFYVKIKSMTRWMKTRSDYSQIILKAKIFKKKSLCISLKVFVQELYERVKAKSIFIFTPDSKLPQESIYSNGMITFSVLYTRVLSCYMEATQISTRIGVSICCVLFCQSNLILHTSKEVSICCVLFCQSSLNLHACFIML